MIGTAQMTRLTLDDLKEIIEIALDEPVDNLTLDSDFYEDLGMDSIGAVAMIVEIQRRTQVRIDEAVAPTLRTPAAILQYVNEA